MTTTERWHLVDVDENGEPIECIEDCPGCHWEGNTACEWLRYGCATCDPDGTNEARPALTVVPTNRCLVRDERYDRVCRGCRADAIAVTDHTEESA